MVQQNFGVANMQTVKRSDKRKYVCRYLTITWTVLNNSMKRLDKLFERFLHDVPKNPTYSTI